MNTQFSSADYTYMQRAIRLAKAGHYTTSPNPRVGCVLVKNGNIIGEGFHAKAGQGHAEVNALKQAGEEAQGCTAYVTLEPCSHFGRTPPCAKALIDAGVKHVIAAMVDPNPKVSGNGLKMLEAKGIKTSFGLLEEDAIELNPGFIHLMTTDLPYVRCKLASSLDGKTAMKNGESQWITSSEARRNVQRLRAQSCAIITGANSVIVDNAKMNVRWPELGELKSDYPEKSVRQPIRVVIDSQNRLTPNLDIFSIESPILIFCHRFDKTKDWPDFVEHIEVPLQDTKLNLTLVLKSLAQRGLNDVLIESGANLVGAFIEQNLADELILFQAPKLMGADSQSLLAFPNVQHLSDAKALNITDVRMVGQDIRITATISKN